MENFSKTYPSKPEHFEDNASIPDPPLFTAEEWDEKNSDNKLVCIEDAECYVMAYVPASRAEAIMKLLNLGMQELEIQRMVAAEEAATGGDKGGPADG